MNDFFRKLLGLGKPAPVAVPVTPVEPERTAAQPRRNPAVGQVTTIELWLVGPRDMPGRMKARDQQGALAGGPWDALARADRNLAAANGNPDADPLRRFGDTPTGTYRLIDILPARRDERGLALFGPNAVLRLRPVTGQAGVADSNGRTALLIHGGADMSTGTDGSIRMTDDGMAQLLALLPADPSSARPAITLVVRDEAASEVIRTATRPVSQTIPAPRAYARGGRGSSSPQATSYRSGTSSPQDDIFWSSYYQQMYFYDYRSQLPFDDRCVMGDPYPYVDCAPVPQGSYDGSGQDQSAAAALGAMGYDTAAQPGTGSSQDPNDIFAGGGGPTLDDTPVQQDPPGPSSTDTASPDIFAGGGSDWTPDAGAYGR